MASKSIETRGQGTKRNYIEGSGRDGKPDFRTVIRRDGRVTSLRDEDHRRARRMTRESLAKGEDEVLSGTKRRYGQVRGKYEW